MEVTLRYCYHTVVTQYLHCGYTAVTLVLPCHHTVVALLLHCCYTGVTVALESRCCLSSYHNPKENDPVTKFPFTTPFLIGSAYADAYISDTVPSIMGPYVRVDALQVS